MTLPPFCSFSPTSLLPNPTKVSPFSAYVGIQVAGPHNDVDSAIDSSAGSAGYVSEVLEACLPPPATDRAYSQTIRSSLPSSCWSFSVHIIYFRQTCHRNSEIARCFRPAAHGDRQAPTRSPIAESREEGRRYAICLVFDPRSHHRRPHADLL